MTRFFPSSRISIPACVLLCALPFVADRYVDTVGASKVYDHADQVPLRRVALVLGTSKRGASGRTNLFYKHRLEATLALYRAGKVERILVSGDNARSTYDEPTDMRDDLVALGIPEAHITLDYAGFRTLDSVIRAQRVFELDAFTVVSQRFHCVRALYLAESAGIDAVGFAARDVGGSWGTKVRLREVLARTKAVLDVHVLDKQPRFLGPVEEIR